MNIKLWLIVFLTVLCLQIIVAFLSYSEAINALTIGAKGINAVKLVSFSLFCVMGFAIIPLFVHLFIVMQLKIGNAEFFLVRFFQEHERAIVYAVWIMMITGFGIIFSMDFDEVLNDFR